MAAVPARVPADEPAGHRQSRGPRARGGGPAVLPDRRRQDRGLPRASRRSRWCCAGCATRGSRSAGVSVLMRYTLRLLTLDQLARAATLVCALELERQKDVDAARRRGRSRSGCGSARRRRRTGWGRRGTTNPDSARAKTIAFRNNDKQAVADPASRTAPGAARGSGRCRSGWSPTRTTRGTCVISCANAACEFTGDNPLPIVAVDEPLYRRLPCFVIATVDKFASLPWVGQVGRASSAGCERYDKHGFYGPCEPGVGTPLERPLLPPDLIIQDELHLISGPLGTMAGLYEAAIEALCMRDGGRARSRPKIVASTATVRRADTQIRALFGRTDTRIFPPPGPDRRDSFFAVTVPRDKKNARLYLGLAAPGPQPEGPAAAVVPAAARRGAAALGRRGRAAEQGEPGRPVHDAGRLLQQPARAGRQPPHRRGRGDGPRRGLRRAQARSARRPGSSATARSRWTWSS